MHCSNGGGGDESGGRFLLHRHQWHAVPGSSLADTRWGAKSRGEQTWWYDGCCWRWATNTRHGLSRIGSSTCRVSYIWLVHFLKIKPNTKTCDFVMNFKPHLSEPGTKSVLTGLEFKTLTGTTLAHHKSLDLFWKSYKCFFNISLFRLSKKS